MVVGFCPTILAHKSYAISITSPIGFQIVICYYCKGLFVETHILADNQKFDLKDCCLGKQIILKVVSFFSPTY